MTATEILVILLSSFLALFLFIGIVLAVLLIRITRQIKRVTDSAERTATSIEHVVSGAEKIATPAMVAKLVLSQFKNIRKK